MGLVRAVRAQISRVNAPEVVSTEFATSSLAVSNSGIRALAKGSNQAAKKLGTCLSRAVAGQGTQGQNAALAVDLANVVKRSKHIQRAVPLVVQASSEWRKGELILQKGVKSVATDANVVAIGQSKTMTELYDAHANAQMVVQYHQQAYGGGNFSV